MKELDFKLVKGVFDPEEAQDVLFSLINNKIRFHQLEAFSIRERNLGTTFSSESRIVELEDAKELISDSILEATKTHAKIKITGDIKIELLES